MRADRLTELLLQERKERAARALITPPRARNEFEYDVAYTRIIAGCDPGYLVKPMSPEGDGFRIACKTCGQMFKSNGIAYCEKCLELPADERRQLQPVAQGRLCQAPGCENFVPRKARADVRYCSRACQQRAYRARGVMDNPAELPYTGGTET